MNATTMIKGALAAGALAACTAASAQHGPRPGSGPHFHGGHWGGPRVDFVIGGPLWWGPGYYYPPPYYPYYYPPAVVAVPTEPPVYVEQPQQQQQPPATQAQSYAPPGLPAGYWYYCADTRTYYPYVQTCASAWQQVTPQSPAGAAKQ